MDLIHTAVGSFEDIQQEMRKMEIIESIHKNESIKKMVDDYGFRMTRRYLEMYAENNISNVPKINENARARLIELHNTYPTMDFPEMWI